MEQLYPLESQLPDDVLKIAELDIKRYTGYDMKLVCKKMHSNFLLDNNVPTVSFMNDDIAAAHLYGLISDKIIHMNNEYWVFNDEIGIWSNKMVYIRRLIHKHAKKLLFNVIDEKGNTSIADFGGRNYNIDQMLKSITNYCDDDDMCLEKNIDSSIGKLFFSDGIYDFESDTFTSGFDPKIVSLYNINKPFQHERDIDAINHSYQKIMMSFMN